MYYYKISYYKISYYKIPYDKNDTDDICTNYLRIKDYFYENILLGSILSIHLFYELSTVNVFMIILVHFIVN